MKRITIVSTLVLVLGTIIGCDKKNDHEALERVGEQYDEAVESINDGITLKEEKLYRESRQTY